MMSSSNNKAPSVNTVSVHDHANEISAHADNATSASAPADAGTRCAWHRQNGRALAARLPSSTGVYQMLDAQGRVLYIGKARDLRKRVASYFGGAAKNTRTMHMLSRVADVQVTLTPSERDALLLENNLIKELKPRYNVLLRDDASYPYIHLDDSHAFPRLGFYRGNRKVPGQFFGPYPSAGSVRDTLTLLKKIFPVRQCEDSYYRNRSRPCLQYQIKRCTAPCVGLISEARYAEDVRQAVLFLHGKNQSLVRHLGDKMEQAAAQQQYESAALYRDRIATLQRVQQQQSVECGHADVDVMALAASETKICACFLFIRGGRNVGSRSLLVNNRLGHTLADAEGAILAQHYLGRALPEEIIVQQPCASLTQLQEELSEQKGARVIVRHRPRGYRARWLAMAEMNAQQFLQRHLSSEAEAARRLQALASALSLRDTPQRIECFDASHTHGGHTVVSCVVFVDGVACKSDYRRFNISDIQAGDDYAALAQALGRHYRRLLNEQRPLPQLLLIDGGKGQLHAVQQALREAVKTHAAATTVTEPASPNMPFVVAIAKGASRKPGRERLFVAKREHAIQLSSDDAALHLLQSVRDEAHRFAISAHRKRRAKGAVSSPLQDIPGIGDKRRRALLRHFGGLHELRRASIDDIAGVDGLSRALAERIHGCLHEGHAP